MCKSNHYSDHIDPEYHRWDRVYPRFPGVAECARLIRDGKATGTWADIVVFELAANANDCLDELIQAFRDDASGKVALSVMMALELAEPPASVPFLAEVVREGHPQFAPYARRTLQAIDTD